MSDTSLKTRTLGFTVVELMITLLIAAVLLGMAAPGLSDLLERNRIQTSANNLFTTLMLTRSEALKRNRAVVMCKSSSGTACTTGTQWHNGWLVYVDNDGDSAADPNEILRVEGSLRNGDTLLVSGADFTNEISYGMDGTASGTGTFVLCNASGDLDFARELDVAITGRPKLNKSTTDCTP